jgi:outer membrane protein assembly factor BamB
MTEKDYPKYLYSYDRDRRKRKKRKILLRRLTALVVICGVLVGCAFLFKAFAPRFRGSGGPSTTEQATTTTIPDLEMKVAPAASTSPAMFNFTTNIFRGTSEISSYKRNPGLEFGRGGDYTDLPGIITFRGNNYREGASYGTAQVTTGELVPLWDVTTGSVQRSTGGVWTGSGWTGQPLIVKWPEETKQIMNLKPEKQADPNLLEVIYPCLDGKIYFLDLKDGSPTREPISTGGGAIKGTASLYPNGIPMLFTGQGDALPASNPNGAVKYRIYSLIDQTLMYDFGTDDPVAYRKWQAFDASPLIDVETDTLIEPGENGILYTIKLNTKFDKKAGTLSIAPEEPVKFRYTTPEYSDAPDNAPTTRWWGMEDSPVAWRNYLYVSDNGGKLMCIDLNTMKLVWAQNILDDSNSSPVLEESIEDGTAYIYISTSSHITAKTVAGTESKAAPIPIWKIDAATGKIVWRSTPYQCYWISGASGGVEGTPVLGKHDISNLVIFPMARTPGVYKGLLVALDKKTGAEVWRYSMPNYAWSSPVAVYTAEGKSYIVICDTVGKVCLLEGATGQLLGSLDTSAVKESPIEASPAIYGNTIVVGSKGMRIYAIGIK